MARDADHWGTPLTDPAVLRALANPARLRMLDVLAREGGATATDCAEVVGLSPSSCSWHLRQLAVAGLVHDADRPDAGKGADGRERRWVATTPAWQVQSGSIDAEPEQAQALDVAVTQALLRASDASVEAFTVAAVQGDEPVAWKDAALVSNMALRMTAEELAAVTEAVRELLRPYSLRQRRDPPPGTRPVHAALRFVPARPATRGMAQRVRAAVTSSSETSQSRSAAPGSRA